MTDQTDIRIGQLAIQAGCVIDSDLEKFLLEQLRRSTGGAPPKLGELTSSRATSS